ncbi:hypothetical protein ACOBR2_09045 [Telmatobacter bradus]|uniref:hypothetical protein n=1 Tax=Telmatobacter bradus TaxID=474953 RepID=UPI003B42F6A2
MRIPTVLRTAFLTLLGGLFCFLQGLAQQAVLPSAPLERLTGGVVVPAAVLQGAPTLAVGSFSRAANNESLAWLRLLHSDAAFRQEQVYQVVMLEAAPGFVRPLIRGGLRRQTPPEWQSHLLLATEENAAWRAFFGVTDESQPAVLLLSPQGVVLWRGNGRAADLAGQLKSRLH